MHIHVGHELRVEALTQAMKLETVRAQADMSSGVSPTVKTAVEITKDAEEFLGFLVGGRGS